MWWRRRPVVDTDVHEAWEMKREAERHMREAKAQAPTVARLTSRLIERRAFNHFGDDIQITFTPRGGHHA